MGFRCTVCKSELRDRIDIAIMEGETTFAISEWSGLTKAEIQGHRTGGHAGKRVTEMVLTAQGKGGVLEPLAEIMIASKVNRLRNLDRAVHDIHRIKEARAIKFKDLPGGETGWVIEGGAVDTPLYRAYMDIHELASKERGEWRPDGGAKAEATNNLAHAIIVHAKGSLPPPRIEQAEVIEAELEDRDHNM